MNNPLRGVLWDLDGVLFDTYDFHFRAWFETLKAYGFLLSRETFRGNFGRKNEDFLAYLFGETLDSGQVIEIGERKEQLFRRLIQGQALLLPGARDWIIRLQNWGIHQAIASSAPHENIEAMVGEGGIHSYFAAIVSSENLPGKPDPAIFLKAAAAIGVPAGDCIVFEDALAGVEAARRAGMKCVAVATTNPLASLQAADLALESLEGLKEADFAGLTECGGLVEGEWENAGSRSR